MNMHSKIIGLTSVNMTSKGQVLIPKDVRDRAGLVPGEPVRVGINDRGETVILPLDRANQADREVLQHAYRVRIAPLIGKFKTGQSTDDYMRDVRGDWVP